MAQLAIKGHATRGREVIELLEMLGGRNIYKLDGKKDLWYILSNSTIEYVIHYFQEQCYTLDEFEARFPYKVGDAVISKYGKLGYIRSLIWSDKDNQVMYELETDIDSLYFANELLPYKEEVMEEDMMPKIDFSKYCKDKYLLDMGDYEIKVENGKTFVVRKKPQYPKTYEECCELLGIPTLTVHFDIDYSNSDILFENLYSLIICRDAYWKIAGDRKPDWTNLDQLKYCIWVDVGEFITMTNVRGQHILAFPTEEMRDAFYENFKDLMESCKELL